METAFITTVFNEEKTITFLLDSIRKQLKKPDEIIIVDGGSKDKTALLIKSWIKNLKSEDLKKRIKFIIKKGNRSVGRNEAVKRATSKIIISSDSGCILDKNFIKNIIEPFKDDKVDVVAGFYKGLASSAFQKSLIPYVLVMPDKVNPKKFLPAARSMAFKKLIWKKVGGFPQEYSYNEDYVFAKKLEKVNAKIIFKRNAVVYYIPRKDIFESFSMFFKFAYGDAESGILRPKVLLVFLRYIFIIWLLIYSYIFKLAFITKAILYILLLYIVWSVWKNYRYVKAKRGFIYLPAIQFTSDIAIIIGTSFGFIRSLWDTQNKP